MSATEADLINIHDLSLEQHKTLVKKTYHFESYFQKIFKTDAVEFDISSVSKLLREDIERLLLEKKLLTNIHSLEHIHTYLSDELKEYNFDDGVNKLSTFFYNTDSVFLEKYKSLIGIIRNTIVKEPFWFQATPTIRIHCPNGKNNHHYPRYHTDIGYGHPPEEINFWLPLTRSDIGPHGFRIMDVNSSAELLKSFEYDFQLFINAAINNSKLTEKCEKLSRAVDTPFRKILAFDSRSIHTGEPLKTHTRVSIDIRVLPVSQYRKMNIQYQGSGRRRIIFGPGHCYHELNSDDYLSQ